MLDKEIVETLELTFKLIFFILLSKQSFLAAFTFSRKPFICKSKIILLLFFNLVFELKPVFKPKPALRKRFCSEKKEKGHKSKKGKRCESKKCK